ncbi:MAG: phosphatidylglycerol lysyltransferase domain-containing protein [Gemmatimonas sp.]
MPRDDARALTLLKQHGHTATAFQVLAPGMHHWFARDTGMVGYIDIGSAWVVAGEPVAAHDLTIPVAEEFVAHAEAHRKRVAFFATEGALASSPRFRRVFIGEQPVWNPMEWPETLRASRSLREQLRRARAKRVVVREVKGDDHATDESLTRLMQRWLATRAMPTMHFLVELEPFVHRESRRLFVAEREGVLVAFLSLAPVSARNGWLFEHLLRDPLAPNGTAELLVDFAMQQLRGENVTWATLGLAPLAGPVSGWLRFARDLARPLFNFTGLAAFKRKLRPTSWEAIYLAYPRERSSVLAMRDSLRAFAGRSLIGFGLHTIIRGPTPLLRALEYSLIPWTIALMLWPARPWFPSPVVKWGWVLFDVTLLWALYRLRRRWTPRIAIAIAAAVSVDTVLTLTQAALWNVSRARTPMELLMVVVACSGPALASVVLWGSVRRRAVLRD